jgi:tetratricopeptide (TPR) repeat protein
MPAKKATIKQKILLIVFGLFISLVIIEVSFRAASLAILACQDYRNMKSIREAGAYRILCIGESTTADGGRYSYPVQLEEVLNAGDNGMRFSVVNKGVSATNTSAIITVMDNYLNKYHPDMVIAMMGINDECGINMPYEKKEVSGISAFISSLRVSKLIRLIDSRLNSKYNPKSGNNSDTGSAHESGDKDKGQIGTVPGQESESVFENGVRYREQGDFSRAIDCFKKEISVNPSNDQAYVELGWIYGEKGDVRRAVLFHKKALSLNPSNEQALIELGWRNRNDGNYLVSEMLLKKALEVSPHNHVIYMELGCLYSITKEDAKKEALLKKGVELNPDNDILLSALSTFYLETGNTREADKYRDALLRLRNKSYNPVTRNNYLRLKEVLDRRGIKLVCVQYPLRDVDDLKKMLEGQGGVVFVDNEKIFSEAVKERGYDQYFYDMFAGDFGHCTKEGNRLLAKNISDTILKDILKK